MGNPIQMCPKQEHSSSDCAVLTATSLGPSLFSFDSKGALQWARPRATSGTGSVTTTFNAGYDVDVAGCRQLLLQRQDYLVEQISTSTGEQVWKFTWSMFDALDFGSGSRTDQSYLLPCSVMPSVMFADEGEELLTFHTQLDLDYHGMQHKLLWRQSLPHAVASTFGINGGSWHPLHVLSKDA